jgi:hypothetical protein
MEGWENFLNKKVRIIIYDYPSQYPKFKDGVLKAITPTHLILLQINIEVAILLADIKRIEIRGEHDDSY